MGGCAGAVLSFAIVRDEYAGNQAARIFSTMLLVMGAAPMLAPTVGSVLVAHASWRLIFGVLAGLALLTTAAVALGLPENAARRPPQPRGPCAGPFIPTAGCWPTAPSWATRLRRAWC